jgi:hypothetical protein
VTPDEDADWSLIDLAKQVFGARNASDVGFDFAETKPAAEDAPPTPLAAEVAVVEQREPATAKTSEEPSPASETAPPRAIAEAKEAEVPDRHRNGRHYPQCASRYRGRSGARFSRHCLRNEPLECHAYNQARSGPDKGRPTLAGARSRYRGSLATGLRPRSRALIRVAGAGQGYLRSRLAFERRSDKIAVAPDQPTTAHGAETVE